MSDQSVFLANETPSEASVLSAMIEFRLAELHTLTPGQVLSYDPVKNTCAVQPLLKRVYVELDGSETVESAPILPEVPIWYPRGAGFAITWPLRPGDIVLLGFCERSIDQWAHVGGEVVPRPARKHDWADAIALPGLAPASNAIPGLTLTDLVVGSEDHTVEIRFASQTKTVTVTGVKVDLGGAGGPPVARVGDIVQIDQSTDPAFFAWLAALSPLTVAPYAAPIKAKVVQGSAVVNAK